MNTMTSLAAPAFKIVGITDERTDCECCSKTGLKRTVMLFSDAHEKVVYYGTACAARALGRKETSVKRSAEEAQARRTTVQWGPWDVTRQSGAVTYWLRTEGRAVAANEIRSEILERLNRHLQRALLAA